jgi:uncharacterized membrane protein
MFKNKITVNFNDVLKYSVIGAVLLMIISLVFRIKTLVILAECLTAFIILALVIAAIYSLLEKYSPETKTQNSEKKENE